MPNMVLNPVYARDAADPFVLDYAGLYWAYRTGTSLDGRRFGILRSEDMTHWEEIGGALDALPEGHIHYWAPEVTYWGGRFYLYYSTGDEVHMQIRVAVSDQPQGPFIDSGRRLTKEKFAIDAHVFSDEDGSHWLFYATDFEQRERVGTGTVMDRMVDALTLEGDPRPVSLPAYDWQIFDPQREEKGNVRWHTIEGSFTLKHKGRYYQMFSGGNYQNPSYGVGYAVTNDLHDRSAWSQPVDGVGTLPILRTLRGRVDGPGHNSVTVGPDHHQLFCCYHRIISTQPLVRALAMDRLEWVGERLVVLGPTDSPQPAPIGAHRLNGHPVHMVGNVHFSAADIFAEGQACVGFPLTRPNFTVEWWQRHGDALRVNLAGAEWSAVFDALTHHIHLRHAGKEALLVLPPGFAADALHRVRLEVNGRQAVLHVDAQIGSPGPLTWQALLDSPPTELSFSSDDKGFRVQAATISYAFEDAFDQDNLEPASLGWQFSAGARTYISDGRMHFHSGDQSAWLRKSMLLEDYEAVFNVRILQGQNLTVFMGLAALPLHFHKHADGWQLVIVEKIVALPEDFDLTALQHIRIWKQADAVRITWLDHLLGVCPVGAVDGQFGLEIPAHAQAELDLVRVTEII